MVSYISNLARDFSSAILIICSFQGLRNLFELWTSAKLQMLKKHHIRNDLIKYLKSFFLLICIKIQISCSAKNHFVVWDG